MNALPVIQHRLQKMPPSLRVLREIYVQEHLSGKPVKRTEIVRSLSEQGMDNKSVEAALADLIDGKFVDTSGVLSGLIAVKPAAVGVARRAVIVPVYSAELLVLIEIYKATKRAEPKRSAVSLDELIGRLEKDGRADRETLSNALDILFDRGLVKAVPLQLEDGTFVEGLKIAGEAVDFTTFAFNALEPEP